VISQGCRFGSRSCSLENFQKDHDSTSPTKPSCLFPPFKHTTHTSQAKYENRTEDGHNNKMSLLGSPLLPPLDVVNQLKGLRDG
jgi:hypothetical protein